MQQDESVLGVLVTKRDAEWKEERINAVLEYCKEPRDRDEMMKFLGIKHRTTFRSDYLNPLLDDGKIAMPKT